jgi:hypothetical protein
MSNNRAHIIGVAILLLFSGALMAASGSENGSSTSASTGNSTVVVSEVNFTATSPERDHLNEEWIAIENVGTMNISMKGWSILDNGNHKYSFPDTFILTAGGKVRIHTGKGENTNFDLFWGRDSPVWNNNGDTVIVKNEAGETVAIYS